MLQSIVVLAVVAVALAVSSPVEREPLFPDGVDGLNEILGGSFFEENVNAIQTKSSEDAVKLQQFEELLSQDEVMTSAYLKYRTMFKKTDASRINQLKDSMLEVARHNLEAAAGQHTWSMGINHFSDMSSVEWKEMMGSAGSTGPATATGSPYVSTSGVAAPASLNYFEQGIVSPVKDQGSCGTCVMFAATSMLETMDAVTNKRGPLDFSPQELTDCAIEGFACPVGISKYEDSLGYMYEYGISSWEEYPYVAWDVTVNECKRNATTRIAGVASYFLTHSNLDSDIEQNLFENGPLGTLIYITDDLKAYKRGVFQGNQCTDPDAANHAVTIVGYGQEGGEKYYLIKNSWATIWGEAGYMKLKYSACGVLRWVYSVKAVPMQR